MDYTVPIQFEPQTQELAKAQHVTAEEVISRIFHAGIEQIIPFAGRIHSSRDTIGAFSNPEEVAAADFALDVSMKDRERRNAKTPHA